MSTQRVTVTYTAPQSFLSTDHWKQVYAALLSQLPLRNLHWKSSIRPTLRTIQELHVNLVAADAVRDEHTSQVPQTVLEKPMLNAYIVVCEDTETYKNTVKKQIKDWHTSAVQRKHQEWLIIHIVRPDSKSTGARIFQMKASVLDKIRADFNVDKRDRCVQLVWASDYENPAAWADLIGKVKDGVLAAFDTAITQREEEVKRSEGQRQMPGWNFCTYFILKESLASSFEGFCLFEEALATYEELEALFFQTLKDKSLSWFGSLINPLPKDDSASLLSVNKKPYRDLILANSISIFDFRTYLLARQCSLLSNLGRVVEVARKAVTFLQTFGKRLREMQNDLPTYFIESWTYSSALSVVEQCDAWAKSQDLNRTKAASFSALKGELIELARHQLDILGIIFGFLPSDPPFSNVLPDGRRESASDPPSDGLSSITRSDLISALQDQESFFELYVGLTNKAIELYASAGRRKFALRMHGSLAALDVVRGRLSTALQTFTSLPAHYAPHGWTSLEAYMLTRSLDLHESSQKAKDREWINVLLEYLKAYVQDLGKALLIAQEDHVAHTEKLVQSLRESAEALDNDLIHHDHPAITISIPHPLAKLAETKDGALLDLTIHNRLTCALPVDEITITLTGRENERLIFSQEVKSLLPGPNTLTLFCPSATMGAYSWHSSHIKSARLIFQWLHMPTANKTSKPKRRPTLVRIPKDVRALDVRLRQPQRVELGTSEPRKFIAVLRTGRNSVSKAMLRLSAPSGVQILVDQVAVESDEDISLETIDGAIVLFNIGADKTIELSVPHTDASAHHAMRVNIVVDYVTVDEPGLTRTIHLARMVLISLPFAINVEDFFRETRLFSRFTLSTTSHQHIHVLLAELRPVNDTKGGLTVVNSVAQKSRITTITPAQPAKFIFQLDSKRGKAPDSVHLHITYCMLREELESFIESATREALETTHSPEDHSNLIDVFVQALENDASWVKIYSVTGELIVPEPPSPLSHLIEAQKRAIEILKRGRRLSKDIGTWREIILPVDVPRMHILAAARLRILPNPFKTSASSEALPPLYAGQPISATLSITTSFHWAPIDDLDSKAYRMRFDVEEITNDWLVSGQKRGDFLAKDEQTFETPITLIALHHGELALPKIAVSALPVSGEGRMRSVVIPNCETSQLHGAEKVLVLPRGGRTTFIVEMGENVDAY